MTIVPLYTYAFGLLVFGAPLTSAFLCFKFQLIVLLDSGTIQNLPCRGAFRAINWNLLTQCGQVQVEQGQIDVHEVVDAALDKVHDG